MKIVAVVQARMGSTRLPGKVLKNVGGHPAIILLLERLKLCEKLDDIVLATSDDPLDSELAEIVAEHGVTVFRGSETDVLKRFHDAAQACAADVVLRITGDCPLIDPILTDAIVSEFLRTGVDYYSNTQPPVFPDGLDVEVFSIDALQQAHNAATQRFEREHVTPYLREQQGITRGSFGYESDYSHVRLTLDEISDLEALDQIVTAFSPRIDMSWFEIVEFMENIDFKNQSISRNEGSSMDTGQKLWKRARKLIPGGNMLLSKRSEMTLPEQWPSYFSKTNGALVWDLDGVEYLDMGIMGVGTNTLGYSHPEVDEAVMQVVKDGNLSTLNAPEEVYLAEKLTQMHGFADMVRFARSGGEANAIAIRIARASTGRDGVAICGYHGWHDWYLSTNLKRADGLDEHLLPGLSTQGVPKRLAGLTHPFLYNDLEELKSIVDQHEIGVIKMEVSRNFEPATEFLKGVRQLATEKGIVLVFDECTSGFRQSFGGLHKLYDVEPDIAVFGKTIGNGYACTAVIGREEVMQAAQDTFISSTFWTERIGSVAALKTLEVMERVKSWETITATGQQMATLWKTMANSHGLKINVSGLSALSSFDFESSQARAYKTYFAQEMLRNNILASTSFFACTEHTNAHFDRYHSVANGIFKTIAEHEHSGRIIDELINGPLCDQGFKRLN